MSKDFHRPFKVSVIFILVLRSTSFISKQEGPKTIIEGSGTLKVKDEQKPANFKYIRTILTEGNEQGFEVRLVTYHFISSLYCIDFI